jgi:exopolysaccharide production protein ExoY
MTPEQQPPATAPLKTPRSSPVQGSQAKRHRVVIVGQAGDVPRALEHPAVGDAREYEVRGVVTVAVDDAQVREHADALHELIREHHAGVVLVAGPLGREIMRAVSDVAQLHGCRLLAVMPSEVVAGHEPTIVWEGESPLVQLRSFRRSGYQQAVKRFADVFISAVALLVFAPLFIVIAIFIKLESRGPALFQHWRVGRRGRGFHCLKFRTMIENAEELLEQDAELKRLYRENHYKLPDELDPRVTSFGRFLRRTSLDELPQLINVLIGEMSLVGPRPIVQEELEHYRGSERLLLSVRPGMSGAWAVNGRHHVGYPLRADLELRYVRAWSLRHDARILARTAAAVLDPGSDLK